MGLRVTRCGYNSEFLIRCPDPDCKFWHDNPEFTVPFLSRPLAKSALPIRVPVAKSPNTYRIFVLGSSACAGYPIPAFSFSRILQVMLKSDFPNANIEVINTANVAINSHVIVEIVRALAHHEPDLFIVYMGNNEVIGPYGPETLFAPFLSSRSLIRASIHLKSLKIGQLLQSLVEKLSRNGRASAQWEGLAMFAHRTITADDPRMKKVYRYYESNLQDIVECARKAGAGIILSTVGSNLKDLAPFASEHGRKVVPEWDSFFEAGKNDESSGRFKQAIEDFRSASAIDDGYAELHFRMGRCYQALRQFARAKDEFIRARDLDALRVRADSKINDIVRQVAAGKKEDGAVFFDAAETLNAHSPEGISGKELFYEHAHLNFTGNYVLAKAMLPAIERQLPAWIKAHGGNKAVLSQEDCARDLGYTKLEELIGDNDMISLVDGRPPFTGAVNQAALLKRLKGNVESIRLYFAKNGFAKVVDQSLEASRGNPDDPWIHYLLGTAYLLAGKTQEGVYFLQLAIKEMPSLKDTFQIESGKIVLRRN